MSESALMGVKVTLLSKCADKTCLTGFTFLR